METAQEAAAPAILLSRSPQGGQFLAERVPLAGAERLEYRGACFDRSQGRYICLSGASLTLRPALLRTDA
jgi:hypothetical protein